jgi:hypothetical protein
MPNAIGVDGLTVQTYEELATFFTAAYQQIYGSDINLASDTPDGQMMNINIQAIQDLQDLLVQIYNTFDPDNAIGIVLDQRVAINGIQRQAGTYTITNITVVTTQSVNLFGLDQNEEAVFTVSDNAGNQWFLQTTQLGLSIGTHVLSFRAATPGANLTIPNTITVPVTIVLGVQSINNPTTYTTLGINEESDAVLKVRRQRSVALSSQGYLSGLLAALENINGVTSVFVYENDTDGTSTGTVPPDVPAGIPSHTIWVIIAGTPTPALSVAWSASTEYAYGNIVSSASINYISIQDGNLNHLVSDTDWWSVYNPVAQAIYSKRSAGCGLKGSTTYTLVQKNGLPFIVKWDVVTAENLFIKFTAASLDQKSPPNVALIRSTIPTSFVPGVNETVNINSLATEVQAVDPNTLVTSAGFADNSGGPFTDTLAPSDPTKQFAVSQANIIILPIIVAGGPSTSGIEYVFNSTTGVVTNTTLSIASGGTTFQFAPVGGFGSYNYTVSSGLGSINPSTGLYTSAGAGADVVQVTDGLGNTATCHITVT